VPGLSAAASRSGSARVAGYGVVSSRDEVRRRIGLVFQQQTLDQQLTALQDLRFHADLYGLSRADAERRIDAVLEMVALSDRRNDEVLHTTPARRGWCAGASCCDSAGTRRACSRCCSSRCCSSS
jgi:ABC-type multidrug transport system ATPase subunit